MRSWCKFDICSLFFMCLSRLLILRWKIDVFYGNILGCWILCYLCFLVNCWLLSKIARMCYAHFSSSLSRSIWIAKGSSLWSSCLGSWSYRCKGLYSTQRTCGSSWSSLEIVGACFTRGLIRVGLSLCLIGVRLLRCLCSGGRQGKSLGGLRRSTWGLFWFGRSWRLFLGGVGSKDGGGRWCRLVSIVQCWCHQI